MSDLLYRTRLRWRESHGAGLAAHEGVRVDLYSRPPVLESLWRLIDLDYAPGVGVAYYQLALGSQTDMSSEQMRECLRYLRAVALAARTAADVGAALLPQEGEA
ncbi:MAG: hypothetical protein ABS84_14950 [Rubrivivax sp. SCN 71-131]|nr:MAG: hypothetical protein ABS84_14950 [Rubrivivax sp. SCN 71-131]